MSFFRSKPSDQISRASHGGRISKPITFTFDGKAYQGYEGDTLASALLANNVHLVGRSKYRRPRGIMAAGSAFRALIRVDAALA